MKRSISMKFFSLVLLQLLAIGWAYGQKKSAPKQTIGIVHVIDEATNLNYNQLLYKALISNELYLNQQLLQPLLVEHQSQADIALDARIKTKSIVLSLYKAGALVSKDTIDVQTLEAEKKANLPGFTLQESSNGILITGISSSSPEYKLGLRNQYKIIKIEGETVTTSEMDKAHKLLQSSNGKNLRIVATENSILSAKTYVVPLYNKTITERAYPIPAVTISDIFKIIFNRILIHKDKLGITNKSTTKFDFTSPTSVAATNDKCLSYLQLPNSTDSKLHYIQPGIKVDSLFKAEKFLQPKSVNKKALPGDAAINVFQFYNYDQNRSHLGENDKIDDAFKEAVYTLSGPFYDKPGVLANYYIAAKEYENAQNYKSALNQYYGAFRKIDDIITSEKTKALSKKIILKRIGYCAAKLDQDQYAKLIRMATESLDIVLASGFLDKSHSNFYTFSENILSSSYQIEKQLKEARSKKFWAIADAITSLGMGAATFNYDAMLSTSYMVSAMDALDANAQYNYELGELLQTKTSEMDINLPPELLEDDDNPNDHIVTSCIIYALENSYIKDKTAILHLIKRYSSPDSELSLRVDETLNLHTLNSANLDHISIVREMMKVEKVIYQHEKRGLRAPDHLKT